MSTEPMVIFINYKTKREMIGFLINNPVPNIGDLVANEKGKLFRVKDRVIFTYRSAYSNGRINTEIKIYVEKGTL